jgi:hypothetical protein
LVLDIELATETRCHFGFQSSDGLRGGNPHA